jgi:hypothetical protein
MAQTQIAIRVKATTIFHMFTRSTLVTAATVALVTVAIPLASAMTMVRPTAVRPILLPASSSSSTWSDAGSSSSKWSDWSSSSSSWTSSSVSGMAQKALKLKASKTSLAEYCKAIAYMYAQSATVAPDEKNADKFYMTTDLMAKSNALCGAMEWSTSSASTWSSSQSSMSSSKSPTPPSFGACKNIGVEKTVLGISYCKYLCGINVKIDVCPKS